MDGINATVIGPVGPDADAQINEIETLMDTIDGLAIASVSTDALAPLLNRMIEEGIPVIAYNTDNPASTRLVFAGQDLTQSGREAGKLMGDVLGGKGKVIITTLNRRCPVVHRPRSGRARGFGRSFPASKSSRPSTPAPSRRKSTARSKTPCWPIPT